MAMDLWSVRVKNTFISPLLLGQSFSEKPICCYPGKLKTSLLGLEDGRVFEIRLLKRKLSSSGFSSLVVKAMGEKNHGNSSDSSVICFLSWLLLTWMCFNFMAESEF